MAQCREYVKLFLLFGCARAFPRVASLLAKALERLQPLTGLERCR
jgi:hypothetical protein